MRIMLCCSLLFCMGADAAPWAFEAPIAVTKESVPGTFVHLESSGRKNIALSAGWVAVTWEDNRDGVPRCYVALKMPGSKVFGEALQVSGQAEAAEPAITGIGNGRFALVWEEAGGVWLRIVNAQSTNKKARSGKPFLLSKGAGIQAGIDFTTHAGLQAVWSEQDKQNWKIRFARININQQGEIHATPTVAVDATASGDQFYPGIAAVTQNTLLAAWEDRRDGHTRIYYAVSRDGGTSFASPERLNEVVQHDPGLGFGSGSGAMRVALAARGDGGVAAVWADKRDFQSGYDVYAGFARSPNFSFGVNEKVQDEFGNNITQWHPALAANAQGRVVVVWDDDRDGSQDVWLSWRKAEGWSGDLAVPGASGAGVQSDPSIAMDEAGNIHLVWVEKSDLNSPSRIRYTCGRVVTDK